MPLANVYEVPAAMPIPTLIPRNRNFDPVSGHEVMRAPVVGLVSQFLSEEG